MTRGVEGVGEPQGKDGGMSGDGPVGSLFEEIRPLSHGKP